MIDFDYTEVDGLLYPNIKIDDEELLNNLGKYGELKYLHTHKRQMYLELFFTGKLAKHCADIDNTDFLYSERIYQNYIKKHLLPNQDFLKRAQICTQASDIADEIVLAELIYT